MTTALTYNDMLSAYRAYPAPIRPYLLRAETHPGIRSVLTKSFLRVFIDILARAPIADPTRPIQVRVDAVAARLALSEKTVSRTLSLMKSNFWLSPAPSHDGRNNYGEFSAREFIIEAPLRHLLGLPEAKPAPGSPPPPEVQQLSPTDPTFTPLAHSESGLLGVEVQKIGQTPPSVDNKPLGTEMSNGVIKGVNKVFLKEASFKDATGQKGSIPHDLSPLHAELGISLLGICSLMALAKQTRQRLQDVWHAKRDTILNSGAREGRAVEYFRSLLQCGEDFSYVARCMVPSPSPPCGGHSTTSSAPSSHSSTDDALRAIAVSCRFKKYVHVKTGMQVRFFDGTAEVSRDGASDLYASDQLIGLYKGIVNGNLKLVLE